MSFVWNWLLLHVFTALLPPPDPNEEDYYQRLGLDRRRRVSADDIRRAYRSKSLQWHPDKIAQRRSDITAAEAAAKFQGIQEAYQVLSDPEKRREYHYWNCSIVRYQFVHSSNTNPMEVFQNLASARIRDKARLVIVVGILLILLILPVILIAAKVNQDLDKSGSLHDASYAAIFMPIWVAFAFYFMMVSAVLILTRNVTLGQIVGLMEMASWLAGLVLLVQRWDGNRNITNWHVTAIPFYFALAFRMIGRVVWIGVIQGEMDKMISAEHLQEVEAEMLSGTSIEDLTEEELNALHARYNVVNPDPMQVAAALEILKAQGIDLRASGQEEEFEAVRVQCSPEYQAAADQVGDTRQEAINMLIFGIPLIPLTAAKIQGDITVSWWVVILPIWMYWTYRMGQVCVLCCGFGRGEDVVVVDASEEQAGSAPENDNNPGEQQRNNNNNNNPGKRNERATNDSIEEKSQQTAGLDLIVEKNKNETMASVEEETEEEKSPPFPTPYNKTEVSYPPEEEVLSEAPSDEGAWREAQPRDPPGVSSDEQELMRLEMERRKALLKATQKAAKTTTTTKQAAPTPAPAPAPVRPDPDDGSAAVSAATDKGVSGDEEKASDEPGIDEDTYRQWQRMQAEADNSAMEAQAKAQWLCCSTCFQMIVVCLTVGKLEQDYPRPADDSVGYSTFWILFPVLLLTGIILCCCSVLICYMGDPNAAYEPSNHDATGEDNENSQNQNESGASQIYVAQPSTTPVHPVVPDIEAPAPAPVTQVQKAEDMNELD